MTLCVCVHYKNIRINIIDKSATKRISIIYKRIKKKKTIKNS